MSSMNVNGVVFFNSKHKVCLNDVQVVIGELQSHYRCYPLLFGR